MITPKTENPLPDFTKSILVELGGPSVYKEGKGIFDAKAVKSYHWQYPLLEGKVVLGGKKYILKLNVRSLTFVENKCNCQKGIQGYMCAHAIALCLKAQEDNNKGKLKEESIKETKPLEVRALKISQGRGLPLEFRITLPPNLKTVAPKDSIMVKVDALISGKLINPEHMDRGRAYALKDQYYKVAALIEHWCDGSYFGMLKLSRSQLKQLLDSLVDLPVIFWANDIKTPISWDYKHNLPGVHGLLDTQEPVQISEKPIAISLKKSNTSTVRKEAVTPPVVDGSPSYLAIKLPSRDAPYYDTILDLLNSHGFKLEPSNRKWWLRDRFKTLSFLSKYWKPFKNDWNAQFSDNFLENMKDVVFAQMESVATPGDNGFNLSLSIKVDTTLESDLEESILKSRPFVDSGNKIYLIDHQQIENYRKAQCALSKNPAAPLLSSFSKHVSHADLVDVQNCLEELSINFEPPESWSSRSKALQSVAALKLPPIKQDLDDRLRNYQRIGVAWLWHLHQNKLSGILADEMGLGKTVQALAFLQCVKHDLTPENPFLVVCPAGLLENWRRETLVFTPDLKPFIHHGTKRSQDFDTLKSYDLIITSYSTLSQDKDFFQQNTFSVIIADEAQHIKNVQTRNAKALRSIRGESRFLLTGTPIENSLQDLAALFEFLMPGYLVKIPKSISQDERSWYQERLLQQAAPYILRRSKQLVAPELPDKIEQIIYCEMSLEQSRLYQNIQQKAQRDIFEMEMANMSENKIRFAALNQLLRLRQACTDPRLIDIKQDPEFSTKLKAFREILQESIDGGHRILVFSQFVSLLKLLKEDLEEQSIPYSYLDGSTKNRLKICDDFNNDSTIPVFLISLKAGGVGLNITGANVVVHFDPWWNPAVEDQATDRAHRIGQTKMVTSIKLIVKDSIEEKVLELQKSKSQMLKDLLDASESVNVNIGLDTIKGLISMDS